MSLSWRDLASRGPKINLTLNRRSFTKSAALVLLGGGVPMLSGCPTVAQWEAIAINDLPGIIQVVAAIFSIAGDPSVGVMLEARIQQITSQVTADLNLVNTLIANYQARASTTLLGEIDAVLTDIQTNLSALLAAFRVENPQLMVTIASVIGIAISAITGLMILIPPPVSPSPTRAYLAYGSTGVNGVKSAFNQVVGLYYPTHMIR